jgi:GNAT superfamily N-acetyltransferase
MPAPSYHFDERYVETARLSDGMVVQLRLVRPEDRTLILAAWERLSPESRYRRFLSSKTRLTDAELKYFTEVDGINHFAMGAVRTKETGEEGLGIARFIRLHERPNVAEPAIAVADDTQGKGLGRLLLSRLVAAARERGVQRFACDVLAENTAMRGLLARISPAVVEHKDGEIVSVELPLDDVSLQAPALIDRNGLLYRALVLAAEGALKMQRSLLELGDRFQRPR